MRPLKPAASRRSLIRNWKQKNQELFTNGDNSRSPSFFLLIHLFIFPSAIMRKLISTSLINPPVFTWSSASVQSIYLLHIACSSAPSKHCPPCTHKSIRPTLIRIQFIHNCFLSTSLINIASLPDHLDQMLLNKATIDSGAHFADWTD